jgi:hypothetical protein
MPILVKLPKKLVISAEFYGAVEQRSASQQIEYWAHIGKTISQNPDLPFSIIKEIQLSDREHAIGEYKFE